MLMKSSVGITTHPDSRELEWRRMHPNLAWHIVSIHDSWEDAHEAERSYAFLHSCQPYWAAEDRERAPRWYLYRVDY